MFFHVVFTHISFFLGYIVLAFALLVLIGFRVANFVINRRKK